MGKKIYKNLIECYPSLKKEFLSKQLKIPDVNILSLDDYIFEYEDMDAYISYVNKELSQLKDLHCADDKEIYLCLASGKNSESTRIKDYYKLWKALNEYYDISEFQLGYEHRIEIDGQPLYMGCAKLDYKNMSIALNILNDYKYQTHGFIYITSSENLLSENAIKSLSDEICNEKVKKMRNDIFDYANLYCIMDIKDIVINLANDGEGLGVFIAQKQS